MLVQFKPEIYNSIVENGKQVPYVLVLRAIYGTVQAALYWYNKFQKDLEGVGFVFNPHDPCIANRMGSSKQQNFFFHVDDFICVKWYVDASFAVHPDFKSHTGANMTFGNGAVQSVSRKQKLNTQSSTTAELVGADDLSVMILWTKLFLDKQGYKVTSNILYQDNKSAMLLEKNGKKSSGKRTRALNIRYFFLTDQVEKKTLTIEYCPKDDMFADYMTKPLREDKFRKFRAQIMGK